LKQFGLQYEDHRNTFNSEAMNLELGGWVVSEGAKVGKERDE